jgi:hypothetical protein
MVRDPHDAVAEGSARAPRMLHQPADAPAPLGPVGGIAAVASFRRVWTGRTEATPSSLRAWAGRISGRSDRRLLLALAAATEAMAAHCDLLVDRVTAQEAVTADVAAALGQEIVQLRAEVDHLQRSLVSLRDGPP